MVGAQAPITHAQEDVMYPYVMQVGKVHSIYRVCVWEINEDGTASVNQIVEGRISAQSTIARALRFYSEGDMVVPAVGDGTPYAVYVGPFPVRFDLSCDTWFADENNIHDEVAEMAKNRAFNDIVDQLLETVNISVLTQPEQITALRVAITKLGGHA